MVDKDRKWGKKPAVFSILQLLGSPPPFILLKYYRFSFWFVKNEIPVLAKSR